MPHGVPHDFRRVGGEHQADVQFPQERLHLRGGNVHPPQPLEHLAECGGVGLAGQGRGEGIKGCRGLLVLAAAGTKAVEIAVFLDALLEDVDQLEIQGESTGCCDGLGEIHAADQLNDRLAAALTVAAFQGHRITQLLEAKQSLALFRGAFAAQHGLPQVFHQLEAMLQQAAGAGAATAGPWLLAVGGMGGGLGHRRSAGLGTAHDHPKAPLRGATDSS